MKAGIDELSVSVPRHYVDVRELATFRGIEVERVVEGLGVESFAVPYEEGLVDLGARALSRLDLSNVRRFYVATESSGDLSKPIGVKVLSRLGIRNAETVEVKFACLAGAQALQDACNYAMVRRRPAVVLCLDRSIYREGGTAELTQGCAAVAMKVDVDPSAVELDFEGAGAYVEDVDDFRVPASSYPYPVVDGRLSVIAYLHAMKMAYDDWVRQHPDVPSPLRHFDYFVFHVPFPKMAHHAFAMLYRREVMGVHLTVQRFIQDPELYEADRIERKKIMELPEFRELFSRKVEPTLKLSRIVGNCYTASIFIALASLLEGGAEEGAKIAFGAYGSGAGALAFCGIARSRRVEAGVEEELSRRRRLSIGEYLEWRRSLHGQ